MWTFGGRFLQDEETAAGHGVCVWHFGGNNEVAIMPGLWEIGVRDGSKSL